MYPKNNIVYRATIRQRKKQLSFFLSSLFCFARLDRTEQNRIHEREMILGSCGGRRLIQWCMVAARNMRVYVPTTDAVIHNAELNFLFRMKENYEIAAGRPLPFLKFIFICFRCFWRLPLPHI